jgi:signal transduction histidine kinase
MNEETLKTVRALPVFANLSDDEVGCFAAGEVVEYQPGDLVIKEGDEAAYFYINVEGEIAVHRIYDNQEILMAVNRPGSFMGEIFILLGIPWISSARALTRARLFRLATNDFWRMLSTCHSVTREVLRSAATRLRNMEGYTHQREKLISLGTMAAGLAHELNNPAAAARRASSHLRETVEQLEQLTCNLSQKFTPANWQDLLDVEEVTAASAGGGVAVSSIELSDREEQLAAWLEGKKVENAWKLAPTYASAQVTSEMLEALSSKLPPAALNDAFEWLEAQITLRSLLREVEESTGRVSELVKSMKSYSYMDQGPVQDVDLHEGITSTLTILKHKMKGARLETHFAPNLPRIQAHGGELNQVWTNLIDNAIYATRGTGKISITTRTENSHVVVEIADNGSGIPREIQGRIFEPFFTTKNVGSGTGLGLVISHRIIADGHGGEIEFESEPGKTVFRVRLPVRMRSAARAPETTGRRFSGVR